MEGTVNREQDVGSHASYVNRSRRQIGSTVGDRRGRTYG
jgi:hypothetical protein